MSSDPKQEGLTRGADRAQDKADAAQDRLREAESGLAGEVMGSEGHPPSSR